MNGTLAALAEQAGYFISFERTGDNVTLVHTKEPGTAGDLALFGELIVRECMRMCDVAAVGYDTHNHIKEANGCCSAKEYIAEHFGVK